MRTILGRVGGSSGEQRLFQHFIANSLRRGNYPQLQYGRQFLAWPFPLYRAVDRLVRDPKLRSQGAPMVIAPEELKMLAVMKMQRSGLDIKGYAEKLGIHPQKHIKLYSHDDKAI